MVPTVRIGNFVKTTDSTWVAIDSIVEIELKYEGKDGADDDYYSVEIMLNVSDFWLPNTQERLTARKHGNFFNQMSDLHHRDVFVGTKADCEKVIDSILRG